MSRPKAVLIHVLLLLGSLSAVAAQCGEPLDDDEPDVVEEAPEEMVTDEG